jgi:eukaryotic-like serine/threonine-protein kinase
VSRWGPGTIIRGRYRLEELLGRGGMGSVWRAEHLELGSKVAVKLLEAGVGSDERTLTRFSREARAASALKSKNVVQVLDHGIDEGRAFIAMELLIGESLRARIARTNGMVAVEALRFITELLRAIHKAHEGGIVHRDLKPDNVFIVKDEPEFVKVLDFGIAKIQENDLDVSAGSMTQTGMMIGTPYYMSPEQAQAKEVDHRTDLWAIAIIAFEALTGKRPFFGDSFGELVISICTSPVPIPSSFTKVPRGFDEWFVHGTQREPARRFQSAREMADELARIATNITVPMRGMPGFVVPKVVPSSAPPAPSPEAVALPLAFSESPTAREKLELTTGQRSAVSSTSSGRPREPSSVAMVSLLGLAALIVIGVAAFMLSGGVQALRERQTAEDAAGPAAVPPPLPSTSASVRPAPASSAPGASRE